MSLPEDPNYGQYPAHDTVQFKRLLPGPIERVWEYITQSDKRAQWLAAGEMDLRVGGHVDLIFNNSTLTHHDEKTPERFLKSNQHHSTGTITECNPPHLLSYIWADHGEVRYELKEEADGVLLTLTHSRSPNRKTTRSVSSGWHIHLDVLSAKLSGRETPRFWETFLKLEAEYDSAIPPE